jgi:hypothetical protein
MARVTTKATPKARTIESDSTGKRGRSGARKTQKSTAGTGRKQRKARVAVHDATAATEASAAAAKRQRHDYDLAPGTALTRRYKGEDLEVKVTDAGFEFGGETFKSISAVARHIVGYQISGPVFFGLAGPGSEEETS